jgi:hypothetical protein
LTQPSDRFARIGSNSNSGRRRHVM